MKGKLIRVLITILFLTITASLFFSPVLLAKPNNPNKPEKPLPDLVEADFKIWIGKGDLSSPEDVVLQPYGDPEIDYLLAEDWMGGSWVPPSTKSKAPREGWGIHLGRVMGNVGALYCGTYDINDQSLLNALNLQGDFDVDNQDVYMLFIGRETKAYLMEDDPKPSNVDYWHIKIVWETDNIIKEVPNPGGEPDPIIVPHRYFLDGKTNMDLEAEGVYDVNTDAWTVAFETVFELFENTGEIDPEGWDIHNKLWEGPLSFTVQIQRILPE